MCVTDPATPPPALTRSAAVGLANEETGRNFQIIIDILWNELRKQFRGNHHDSEEVVSDSLLKIWRKYRTQSESKQRSLARTIARNTLNDFYRRQARFRRYLSQATIQQIQTSAANRGELSNANLDALEYCLAGLSDEDRQLLEDFQDDTAKAIAEVRGCPESTIHRRLREIRRQLRRCILGRCMRNER